MEQDQIRKPGQGQQEDWGGANSSLNRQLYVTPDALDCLSCLRLP